MDYLTAEVKKKNENVNFFEKMINEQNINSEDSLENNNNNIFLILNKNYQFENYFKRGLLPTNFSTGQIFEKKKNSLGGNENNIGNYINSIENQFSNQLQLQVNNNFGGCSCKKTKCLKLYCECFSKENFCGQSCKCLDCKNMIENSENVFRTIKNLKNKKPEAFTSKILSRTCNCKKSNCKKKYCECFENGNTCNDQCKCFECKNKTTFKEEFSIEKKIKIIQEEIPK